MFGLKLPKPIPKYPVGESRNASEVRSVTKMSRHADWAKLIFEKLVDAGVTLFPYVPDFGNDDLVKFAEADNRTVPVLLSSEQEGVALCAGADLVGGRGVLLM